jgi:hypothetical protein
MSAARFSHVDQGAPACFLNSNSVLTRSGNRLRICSIFCRFLSQIGTKPRQRSVSDLLEPRSILHCFYQIPQWLEHGKPDQPYWFFGLFDQRELCRCPSGGSRLVFVQVRERLLARCSQIHQLLRAGLRFDKQRRRSHQRLCLWTSRDPGREDGVQSGSPLSIAVGQIFANQQPYLMARRRIRR